ncbi:MAG: hypothetical protein OMM_09518 [Candidatus Magnetoglobus multicellularis str. Araruama]|uniref:DUF5615 domain-containing protein n=1 Tax=Candidatus Magnetoglobus multicellularis str. Araruama TaxID=890399 RepID=A0A1V1P3P9_9BACT|nr:MAG: hypothetical protein OMM_09518 [Candidatus Magnetoglobus multicellularis str. Araruama]
MNLSPEWVKVFSDHEIEAIHWIDIGDPRSTDETIMNWAEKNGYIIFTHDLDFGTLLAATQKSKPSVIQVRTHDVTPNYLKDIVINAINQFETHLKNGALIVVNEKKCRARILPINNKLQRIK